MAKILFIGTPHIAENTLKALIDMNANIVGVVTKPDKLVGRKQILTYSEVKQLAIKNNIRVFQPEKISEIYNEIKQMDLDLIVCCAYGNIIPEKILKLPKFHCINIHTSLLPKYRGASPIHHTILNNEKYGGITYMFMDKGMDTGNIIKQFQVTIEKKETYSSLYNKLCNEISRTIPLMIPNLLNDNVVSTIQNEKQATYTKIITKEDEKLDWNQTAINIDCKVRSLCDTPHVFTLLNNKLLKIYEIEITNIKCTNEPGTIEKVDKTGIYISTKDFLIKLIVIQFEGKKASNVKDILNGKHGFIEGFKLK